MKHTRTALRSLSLLAILSAPLALAHDEELGALAPVCVVNKAAPFGTDGSLARVVTLEAELSNLKENPSILDRVATGTFRAVIRLERSSAASTVVSRAVVSVVFRFTPAQAETITIAHIHAGLEGSNGGILIPLNPAARFDVAANGEAVIASQFEITDQTGLTNILAIADTPENFYANAHTASKPGGLVRGQLRNAITDDTTCLRSAVGAVGDEVHELSDQIGTIATAAGTVGTAIGTLQADITALKTAAAAIQADIAALKNASTGNLDASLKTILRLVILSAARDGVIGAAERDQLLAAIK